MNVTLPDELQELADAEGLDDDAESGLMDDISQSELEALEIEKNAKTEAEKKSAEKKLYIDNGLKFRNSGGQKTSSYVPYRGLAALYDQLHKPVNRGYVGNIPSRYLADDDSLSIWQRIANQTRNHFKK